MNFTWNNIDFKITAIGGGLLDKSIPRHTHSKNSYELHFILDGKGKLITDDKEYELKEGNFFITGPNTYHSQESDYNNPVRDIYIMLQAENINKANSISQTFLDTHFCFIDSFKSDVAKEIYQEYKDKKIDYKTALSGLCTKLLTDITRCLLPSSFSENLSSENLNDKRFVIIENAFLYTSNLTLTQLANKIGVCERQTERLLKKYYGKTFREKKQESKKL
jgi:mannose-6-phosphate isomerase-like protein (cupin superfamily)